MKAFLKKYSSWIIICICLFIFSLLAVDIFKYNSLVGDEIGYSLISNLISDQMTPVMKVFTFLGSTYMIVGSILVILLVVKDKKIGILVASCLAGSAILNNVIKLIVQRIRPQDFQLVAETGYSFPSGHSMNSMVFYGILIYLVYLYVKDEKKKYALITLLSIIIFLIGISRIYLGVHYTSDVLAGFMIGLSYLLIFINLIKRDSLS